MWCNLVNVSNKVHKTFFTAKYRNKLVSKQVNIKATLHIYPCKAFFFWLNLLVHEGLAEPGIFNFEYNI
jgi:hypothetical protein